MPFSGSFTVTSPDLGSEARWRLERPFTWHGPHGDVEVPAGFLTDGTTAPRLLWPLLPPFDARVTRAALVHDYLYDRLAVGRPHPAAPDRASADLALLRAARDAGVGPAAATLIWACVRLFGRAYAERAKPTAA